MISLLVYGLAALAEIAGCFAFWAWWRLDRTTWWLLPGLTALAGFATLLAAAGGSNAGRSYAAYGGIYVAASLGWLWGVEGVRPDRWDLLGASIVLAGAATILLGPRPA